MPRITSKKIAELCPAWLKAQVQKRIDLTAMRRRKWVEQDPFREEPPFYNSRSGDLPVIGIIKEFWHLHWHYTAACRELDVSYRLLDISGPNWMEEIEKSKCDAFLTRPTVISSPLKEMYDERLRIIEKDLGRLLFPSFDETWIWESKRRMHYWLGAHYVPHPQTWVFYQEEEAIQFVTHAELPLVFKSDMGSGGSGVLIFRDRSGLINHIRRCFRKGYSTHRRPILDREWGSVLLQEYLPGVREWRIIRIGDSFFGFEKLQDGDFHSGSGKWSYGWPPDGLLDFVKAFTDQAGFKSMAADVFVDRSNHFYVNELQTLFGQHGSRELCRIDGQSGRIIFDPKTMGWKFEAGEFCRNNLCNERVKALLKIMDDGKE